jgi:23S rRNA (guanine2445-N2)-methyltransferase
VSIFVTAAAGTEVALRDELRELGLRRVRADRGGVRLPGAREEAALICLRSRIAVRVLIEIGRFPCPNEDALYDGASAIEWERWLEPRLTLAVSAVSKNSNVRHTNYIAQRTKDAIVDRQRRRVNERSSVERHDPDVGIFVHLSKNEAALFLDASGGSLHQRGWRTQGGPAPLKETLAAALLRLSGWDRATPLCDPMCGSGTLPIEADLWARGVAPQRPERVFGLERWADFDRDAADALRQLRVTRAPRSDGPACLGFDRDRAAIELARQNARRARSLARFEAGELASLRPPAPGLVIVNPPYGERLEADDTSWRALGRTLDRLSDQRVAVLLPEDGPPELLRRRAESVFRVWNGALPCRFWVWTPR